MCPAWFFQVYLRVLSFVDVLSGLIKQRPIYLLPTYLLYDVCIAGGLDGGLYDVFLAGGLDGG